MQRVKTVIKLVFLLLGVYFLLRITFGLLYFKLGSFSFAEDLQLFYWGIRMDLAALFYINILFFLFYFFLAPLFAVRWQKLLSLIIFSIINLPFIALNFIDLVYYRYNLRRSTIDIFYVFDESIRSFGSLFRQYWFVLLAFLAIAVLFVIVVNRILKRSKIAVNERWYIKWGLPVLFIGIFLFLARGTGSRPIVPSTPLLYVEPSAQPLVNNSTFNLLYSCLRSVSKPERKNYFTDSQLDSIYTIRRQYSRPGGLQKKNVVIFVLESFSADFFNKEINGAYTPFLDSLMKKSTVCSNAYANGGESVKGLPAILASIPPFLEEPLFLSNYNSIPFRGIGSLLKEQGYTTNFFHGAEYDHFNFAKLCRMIGIDNYYSKENYGHPEHDDGNWGIYDEFFFSYFADVTAKQQQPFLSVLFNISSHPPFDIPVGRKVTKVPGEHPQLKGIRYVDQCFRELFDRIKTQPWFANSIFLFVSDHTLVENTAQKSYQYKAFHIPFFIYEPGDSSYGIVEKPVQQLDVMPTILHRLGYEKPFMSFGNSIFDTTQRGFSIQRVYTAYQLIDSTSITGFDEQAGQVVYHYDHRIDTALVKNLYPPADSNARRNADMIKAVLQRFNNSLLDHKLMIEK
jgi:phosphoglycerol transferase MdoB-like AlkP superfamily enzyme